MESLRILGEELRESRRLLSPASLVELLKQLAETEGMNPDKDLHVLVALDTFFGVNVAEKYIYLMRIAAKHRRLTAYKKLRDRAFAQYGKIAQQWNKQLRDFNVKYLASLLQIFEKAVESEKMVRMQRSYGVTIPTIGGEEE